MATQSRVQTLLLTRPEPQAARFAKRLRSSFGDDLRIIISPLMQPRFLHPALPPRNHVALVLTSETAAEAARRISAAGAGLPRRAFCVGDRTAEMARAAGFETVSAQGDAERLLALIQSQNISGPLLYLHGADTRGNLGEKLNLAGIETDSAMVYDQIACPLSAEAQGWLRQAEPLLLPLFSPRSARLLVDEAQRIDPRAPLWIAALSPAVALEAAALHPARLEIAADPNADALLVVLHGLAAAGQGS